MLTAPASGHAPTHVPAAEKRPAGPVAPRRPFRPHPDTDAATLLPGLLGALTTEWARTCGTATAQARLATWRRQEPAIAALFSVSAPETPPSSPPRFTGVAAAGLDRLLDEIDAAPRAAADAALRALITRHRSGDHLAGQTLLQAMAPKLWHMTRRIRPATLTRDPGIAGHSRDEQAQTVITAFWEALSTIPLHRSGSLAANLALDTLNRATTARRRGTSLEVPCAPELGSDAPSNEHSLATRLHQGDRTSTPLSVEDQVAPRHSPDSNGDLWDLLAWAVRHDVVSASDAHLLIDVYAPPLGVDGGAAAAAQRWDLTVTAVRQRCSRARRALVEAVRRDADQPLDLAPTAGPRPSHRTPRRLDTPRARQPYAFPAPPPGHNARTPHCTALAS